MEIRLRPIVPEDAETCGRIIFEAFRTISERHHFTPDFLSVEFAIKIARFVIASPANYGVVAEVDGRVAGSNFLAEHNSIRAVGPITVDPAAQGQGIGRRLMEAVIERGRNADGIRLVQDAFNTASLSLYAALGFDVREPLVLMEGRIAGVTHPGVEIRPLQNEDLGACAELCRSVHGFDRVNEIRDLPPHSAGTVALREDRLVAYASALNMGMLNHGVAECEEDMRALLSGAGAGREEGLSFILPTRQTDLFRWCLAHGMRVVKPMTLMTMGFYQKPKGCYLMSIGY